MTSQRLNVLFVDDDQKIVDGLRRQLRGHREQWEMRFATSGESALKMLADTPADIIVSDMRMPGMTGGQLLARVRELYPQITRMILSGQTDQADLLGEIGSIHQYLQKPCDGEVLCQAIERARALAQRLGQPALLLAANRVTALPPATETYRALVDELAKTDASLSKVSVLVAKDPALTAKVMQLVNSAFFGMPRKVSNSGDAVVLLGLNTIQGIVIASRLFDFLSQSTAHQPTIAALWQASVLIGESACRLARKNGATARDAAQAQLAGLLSLIGRVLLLTATPQKFEQVVARVKSESRSYSEAEEIIYGATQDEMGAYALGIWAFSDDMIESIAFQSHPSLLPAGKTNDLVAYVHLARALHAPTVSSMDKGPELDIEFLRARGYAAMIPQPSRKVA